MKEMKTRRVLGVAIILMVLLAVSAVPAMACPCEEGNKELIEKAGIIGIEKYGVVAAALNLDEVKVLTEISQPKDSQPLIDSARAFLLTRKMEDGSIESATTVILPVETVAINNESVKSSNVVVVWAGGKTKVVKCTGIYSQSKIKDLTLTIIGENNKPIRANLISDGSLAKEVPAEFTALDGGYWECMAECLIGDCLCAVMGITCPPGTPSICDICAIICAPCLSVPCALTCTPCAGCLCIEIASCAWKCA
ncbi:MAG: hypothetical protein U9N36_05730 [Euryarchaeota archaeon]|nr:hypothetical protein [Euryarchaeota archaeon]